MMELPPASSRVASGSGSILPHAAGVGFGCVLNEFGMRPLYPGNDLYSLSVVQFVQMAHGVILDSSVTRKVHRIQYRKVILLSRPHLKLHAESVFGGPDSVACLYICPTESLCDPNS